MIRQAPAVTFIYWCLCLLQKGWKTSLEWAQTILFCPTWIPHQYLLLWETSVPENICFKRRELEYSICLAYLRKYSSDFPLRTYTWYLWAGLLYYEQWFRGKNNSWGGNNVTADHWPFLWMEFFYISEFISKYGYYLLECCPVGGNLQGRRRLSPGCILSQQKPLWHNIQ